MFYNTQSKEQQENYKNMLEVIGALSNLFTESKSPILSYRAHENCFCKYFNATNLARKDCSVDANKGTLGIGLKTWTGGDIQKVAEFGKLSNELKDLNDDELVLKVSEYRNERISTTMNKYGLENLIYHVVIREKGKMKIAECNYEKIDCNNIVRLLNKDRDNTRYFTDGKNVYNYNKAKNTLYMSFDKLKILDEIDIDILENPFEVLGLLFPKMKEASHELSLISQSAKNIRRKLAIKLYKQTKNGGFVEEKSGLNIWNANGRKRHPNEVYIPFNKVDRERPENKDFFPPQDQSFNLLLPDGQTISAKVCQDNGKAIMSNPNKALGKWLLRDVLELPEGTLITYNLLQEKGFDTVVFEKIDDLNYTVDFTDSSIYYDLYKKD